jgi:hypothetical protein
MMSLGEYIAALINTVQTEHPAAFDRLLQVVLSLRARIVLDEEAVDISLGIDGIQVESAHKDDAVDGVGAMDTATVVALLDGLMEVSSAILDGRIQVTGSLENVARMFLAIEILLDVSARTPKLQNLARRFLSERAALRAIHPLQSARINWYPFSCTNGEFELLQRLGLLPQS